MYLNYYTKIRASKTEEELKRELKNNAGRIVTKIIEESQDFVLPKNRQKLRNMLQSDTVAKNRILTKAYRSLREDLNNPENWFTKEEFYETFEIPKRRGGTRTITAPTDEMKEAQRYILKCLKDAKVLPHNAAHGFTRYRNCKTALQVHQRAGSRWFLKLDIKDFFDNIKIDDLLKSLLQNVLITLQVAKFIALVGTADGALTQGAPTSPMLSNLYLVMFDEMLTKACKKRKLTYTRYADDMLISSKYDFSNELNEIIQEVKSLLETHGLELSESKIRYGSFNGRNWNLGLMFNNQNKITIGHAKKKLIKNMLHNFYTKEECHNIKYAQQLSGMIAYAKFIEPEYFKEFPTNLVKEFNP